MMSEEIRVWAVGSALAMGTPFRQTVSVQLAGHAAIVTGAGGAASA